MYGSEKAVKHLYDVLTLDGILIIDLGESPNSFSPAEEMSRNANRARMCDLIEKPALQAFIFMKR